jgi:hypothetical protein
MSRNLPNVNCSKTRPLSGTDLDDCNKCFTQQGKQSFFCAGQNTACLNKDMYTSNTGGSCPDGSFVAMTIDNCLNPCLSKSTPQQQPSPPLPVPIPQPSPPQPGPKPSPPQPVQPTGNNIMDLMTNCSQDMSNINSLKKCLLSVTNLSCDDINTLVLYIKQNYPSNDNYRAIKQLISEVITTQNEQLITDILNGINNSVDKVNCTIDSLNKNFDLQTPKINTDNVKKQIVQNIYSNSSEKLQNDLLSNFSCSKNYKMISMVIMAVIIFLLLVFIYLYMRK